MVNARVSSFLHALLLVAFITSQTTAEAAKATLHGFYLEDFAAKGTHCDVQEKIGNRLYFARGEYYFYPSSGGVVPGEYMVDYDDIYHFHGALAAWGPATMDDQAGLLTFHDNYGTCKVVREFRRCEGTTYVADPCR